MTTNEPSNEEQIQALDHYFNTIRKAMTYNLCPSDLGVYSRLLGMTYEREYETGGIDTALYTTPAHLAMLQFDDRSQANQIGRSMGRLVKKGLIAIDKTRRPDMTWSVTVTEPGVWSWRKQGGL